jgi:uncharacterized membrane protein YqgA involved in biofilm formation
MIGAGTIVNTAAIIAGGVAGGFLRNGLPEKYKNIILQGVGLSVIVIGISGTLVGMLSASSGGQLERSYVMTMIFSLLIGGVIGELLKIEDRLNHVGVWLQGRLKGGSGMSEGFVSATLLFCVGAMSIVGSIQDGLTGNASTLYAKSILDGVMAAVLASTMGFGVVFSAVSVFVYQGSITLLAGGIKPWLTDPVIAQVSVVGNILIIAIGINVLGLKKIKVGNLIPSVFLPFIYYLITQLILKIKI